MTMNTSPRWHFPRTLSGNVTLISGRLIRISCVVFARFPQPSRTSHILSTYCTHSRSYVVSTNDSLSVPLLRHRGAEITFGFCSFFFTSAGQPSSISVSISRIISGGSVTKSSSIRPREKSQYWRFHRETLMNNFTHTLCLVNSSRSDFVKLYWL
jgi:hypothetical protein